MPMKVAQIGAAALAAMLALGAPALAQEHYPSRMLTIVVPITAGTTIDILARLYGEALSRRVRPPIGLAKPPRGRGPVRGPGGGGGPPPGPHPLAFQFRPRLLVTPYTNPP